MAVGEPGLGAGGRMLGRGPRARLRSRHLRTVQGPGPEADRAEPGEGAGRGAHSPGQHLPGLHPAALRPPRLPPLVPGPGHCPAGRKPVQVAALGFWPRLVLVEVAKRLSRPPLAPQQLCPVPWGGGGPGTSGPGGGADPWPPRSAEDSVRTARPREGARPGHGARGGQGVRSGGFQPMGRPRATGPGEAAAFQPHRPLLRPLGPGSSPARPRGEGGSWRPGPASLRGHPGADQTPAGAEPRTDGRARGQTATRPEGPAADHPLLGLGGREGDAAGGGGRGGVAAAV